MPHASRIYRGLDAVAADIIMGNQPQAITMSRSNADPEGEEMSFKRDGLRACHLDENDVGVRLNDKEAVDRGETFGETAGVGVICRMGPPRILRRRRPLSMRSRGPARTLPMGAPSPFDRHAETVSKGAAESG